MRFSTLFFPVVLTASLSVPARAQATTIILARHAEKAAPTGDPGLTAVGVERARDLAVAVAGVHLAAILITPYQRTQLTATPAADAAGLVPLVIPIVGGTNVHAAAVARTLDSLPAGSVALVVGHSNTLGPIIAALGGPPVPDRCDAEHSTLFILERPGGGQPVSLVRSHYGAAEPPEASRCQAGP